MGEIVCRFQTLDGTSKAFYIDSATTVTEALGELCKKIGLKDPRGWAVFITYNNISRGLGEKERLAGMPFHLQSAVTKCVFDVFHNRHFGKV